MGNRILYQISYNKIFKIYIYILFIQTYCVKNIYIMINKLKKIFFKKNKLNGNQLKAEPSLHSKEKNNNQGSIW